MKEIHLHDNRGKEDQHLGIGKGNFNFDRLFKHLSNMNEPPILTIEAHTEKGIRESLTYLKNYL